jgi:hypothetical protein
MIYSNEMSTYTYIAQYSYLGMARAENYVRAKIKYP